MSEVTPTTALTPLTQPFNRGKNATSCNCLAELQAAFVNVRAIGALVIKELFRRKDFYALFILTALITLILGSVNFFNEAHVVRYLKEICLFLIWTSSLVIAITTTARQIPVERESRTIFPLLAKPVTRAHVVMGLARRDRKSTRLNSSH